MDKTLNTTLDRMWKCKPALLVGMPALILLLGIVRFSNGKGMGPWFWLGMAGWLGIVAAQHGRWTKNGPIASIGVAVMLGVGVVALAQATGWIAW